MRIGIIGAGRLGASFARGLFKKSILITGVYSKSEESQKAINIAIGQDFENSLTTTIQNSTLVFITVPDDDIEKVSMEIASKEIDINAKCFLHCSGSLTSEVLKSLASKGAVTGSLHPLQTFADKQEGYKGLDSIYYGFEGNVSAKGYASHIIDIFNGKMLELTKDSKRMYHGAACIMSNYLVTLTYMAEKLYEEIGFDSQIGIEPMKPLIYTTLENIFSKGSTASLTGPISRGDTQVVLNHINKISDIDKKFAKAYVSLGRITLDIACEKDTLTLDRYNRLLEILEK